MRSQSIEQVVIAAVEQAANRPSGSVTPSSSFEDLELDSLGVASVISEIEGKLGLQFSPDDLMRFLNVRTVEDFLATLGALEGALSDVAE